MINTKSNAENHFVRLRILFEPNQFLGSALVGIVSGIAGGLVMGVTARISMRAVALLADMPPSFSFDGTLTIIGFGALFGALAGLVYGFILPFLPGSIRQKGLVFGGILSLLITFIILFIQTEGELALVSKWALFALFASLPLVYGFVLGRVAARLVLDDAKLVGESGRFTQTAALITIAAAIEHGLIELTLVISYPAVSNLGYNASTFLDNAAGGTLLLMAIIGTAGLLRSTATGKSVIAKIGLGLALLILSLLGSGTISEGSNTVELHGLVRVMTRLEFDENLVVLLAFFSVGLSGLVLAGIAAIRAQRWQGWHRYCPLLVGLYPFLSLLFLHPALFPALLEIPISGRNQLAHGIGALFALCWLMLGIALRAETGQTRSNEIGI